MDYVLLTHIYIYIYIYIFIYVFIYVYLCIILCLSFNSVVIIPYMIISMQKPTFQYHNFKISNLFERIYDSAQNKWKMPVKSYFQRVCVQKQDVYQLSDTIGFYIKLTSVMERKIQAENLRI